MKVKKTSKKKRVPIGMRTAARQMSCGATKEERSAAARVLAGLRKRKRKK